MKLAFCVEDDSDERTLCALVSRVIGERVELHQRGYRIRRGGRGPAMKVAYAVARAVHQSDADGAVFAVDNDGNEPRHEDAHAATPVEGCHHCELQLAAEVQEVLSWPRPALPPLRFVFSVPVQTIESWLLLARDGALPGNDPLFGRTGAERKRLKEILYGRSSPTSQQMIDVALPIAENFDVANLRKLSVSFDLFVRDLIAG